MYPHQTPTTTHPAGHDRAVDYWSIGCLIFEMLFGCTPFYEHGIDQKGLFKNIVRGKWKPPYNANKLSKAAMDMIKGLLQKRPTERLGEYITKKDVFLVSLCKSIKCSHLFACRFVVQ